MDENTSLSEISDSILSSVKKLIGISEDDKSFDLDIMLNINAASSTLFQLGILQEPFTVSTEEDKYEDLLPRASKDVIDLVKMYFVYKTRLGFDSSTMSSSQMEVIKEMIKETEWRLMATVNPEGTFE